MALRSRSGLALYREGGLAWLEEDRSDSWGVDWERRDRSNTLCSNTEAPPTKHAIHHDLRQKNVVISLSHSGGRGVSMFSNVELSASRSWSFSKRWLVLLITSTGFSPAKVGFLVDGARFGNLLNLSLRFRISSSKTPLSYTYTSRGLNLGKNSGTTMILGVDSRYLLIWLKLNPSSSVIRANSATIWRFCSHIGLGWLAFLWSMIVVDNLSTFIMLNKHTSQ